MTADAALAAGRAAAEALMVDQCELRGADVRGARDPATNRYAATPGPLRYAGPCKVQSTDTIGNDAAAGERLVMVTRFEVHLPVSAAAARVDDVVTVTASVADPQLVGRRFRVVSLIHKSYLTARRLAVEEVQS